MRTRVFLIALSVGCLILPVIAGAQVPDEFTNLEVLPKDIGKQELLDIMKGFSAALGVRCSECHVQKVPGDFSTFDWASDDLQDKDVARGMMRLVADLNGKLLPEATGDKGASVSCVICHRGVSHPRTLADELIAVAEIEGVEAAATRYHALRDEYYGSGSYDFRPASLATVAEAMAEADDLDGARRMAELNLEMNPDTLDTRLQLAQIELAAGNLEAAQAQVEAVLAQDPEHRHAKRLQQRLQK